MRRISFLCLIVLILVSGCSDPDGDDQTITSGGHAAADTDDIHADDAGDTADAADTFDAIDSADARGSDAADTSQTLAATDDFFVVLEGTDNALDVLANDGATNAEIEVIRQPASGEAAVSQDGGLEYRAPQNFNGYVSLDYRVTAGAETDEATVFVGVYATLEGVDAQNLPPMVDFARRSIQPSELGVIINTNDPVSVSVGEYYAEQRGLPDENVIRVQVPTDSDVLARDDFEPIRQQIEADTPDGVQAYALTFIKPYRVDCMSITTAVAVGGFDDKYCSSPCATTATVDYYNSASTRPYDDHEIRPTMVLGGVDEAEGRALVDRGIAAEASFPGGRGHFVKTSDSARSVRWYDFQSLATAWAQNGEFEPVYTDDANTIEGDDQVLFYFTGLASVSGIDTNTYVPGAVADHLTSYGGKLTATGGQMSIMRWLEAGATGSYGTVVEPCNYTQKFPHVSVFLSHYFRGETLVEAYWKSVQMPGEGIFVGDPLARPWGRHFLRWEDDTLTIETTMLEPGRAYEIVGADSADGDMQLVQADLQIPQHFRTDIIVDSSSPRFLRLQPSE